MPVNLNSSVVGNQNTQTSVPAQNCLKKTSEGLKNTKSSKKEDLELSKKCFGENLIKNYNRTGIFKGYYSYDGAVNDKVVSLKYKKNGLLSGYKIYKGQLGDQNTDLKIESKFLKGKNITGVVGDKELDLTFKTGLFGNFSISGKIGEKDINITKGSYVDSAQGENDILTLLNSLVGRSFNVKNGKFGSLGLSKQVVIEYQQGIIFQQQQMLQEQEMLHRQQMLHRQMINNQMMRF